MVAEPETIARALGQLEGRITELSVFIQEVNRRMDAGFQAIRQELQEVNHRMDAGFQEVNHRIDRMLLALLVIGGGLVIAQTGLMATLIIRGG